MTRNWWVIPAGVVAVLAVMRIVHLFRGRAMRALAADGASNTSGLLRLQVGGGIPPSRRVLLPLEHPTFILQDSKSAKSGT